MSTLYPDTSTPGKKNIEENWRDPILKEFKYPKNSLYVSMVGKRTGFDRHYDHAISLGFAPENIVFIDRDIDLVREIIDESYETEKPCVVLEGDFMTYVKQILEAGNHIGFVDFDGTEILSEYHYELADLLEKYRSQITAINFVICLRGFDKPTGMRDFIDHIDFNLGFYSAHRTYFGKSPMFTIVMSDQKIDYKFSIENLRSEVRNFRYNMDYSVARTAKALNASIRTVRMLLDPTDGSFIPSKVY